MSTTLLKIAEVDMGLGLLQCHAGQAGDGTRIHSGHAMHVHTHQILNIDLPASPYSSRIMIQSIDHNPPA